MRWFARGAFFISGIAGLTFEIVWLRSLGLAVGATTLAVATTTAAYMGGLALGSHLGGKIADRVRRPLTLYGLIEIGVAGLGLLVPSLCAYVPLVDEHLLTELDSGFGRALVRFFVAALVLLLPTTAMGMTLPILARAVSARLADVGREVGTLYAINIAGAVVGAGVTGFVLIPRLGIAASNHVAVAGDLALGLLAVLAGFVLPIVPVHERRPAPLPLLREGTSELVAVLAATGAVAMALQILWTRALSTALGPSTYAFSAIVCAYLVGLAGGGALAARLAHKVRDTRFALALVLTATGLACMFGIAMVDDLPALLHPVVLDEKLTMGGLVRTEFALAALSLLPATLGMGAIFPLTLSAVVGSEERLGAAVGRAYAVNTLGNIFGCFAGLFVLLHLFGVEWGMRLAALAYPALALALLARRDKRSHASKRARKFAFAAVGVTACVLVLWPSWDIGRWTLGLYRLSMTRAYYSEPGDLEPARVIYHADGMASTVTVEEDAGTRWIKVNGKIDGSSSGDMPTQILSGILPMLVHPQPEQVAIIGCGSCVTVGAALRGNPKHVTLVELESKVVEAAHLFADVNHEPWQDPRLTIVEDDGRNFMMRSGPSFDVIISEPSNPWMTGASSLFTAEFFRIAARRLNEGGLFLQWLQAYELAPERIASVLKTFQSVFPYVLVFSAHPDSNDLLLLGSRTPVLLTRARLTAHFTDLSPELARADVHEVDDLLALLLATGDEFAAYLPDVALNTDDNALIEFGAPRDLLAFAEDDPELPLIAKLTGQRAAMVQRLGGTSDTPAALLSLARAYLRQGMLSDAAASATASASGKAASREIVAAAEEVIDLAGLLDDRQDVEAVVDTTLAAASPDYKQAAALLAQGEAHAALVRFEQAAERPARSAQERLLYAYLLYSDGQWDAARRHFVALQSEPALAEMRPAITYYLARTSYNDGAYARAVTEIGSYRQLRAQPLSHSRK